MAKFGANNSRALFEFTVSSALLISSSDEQCVQFNILSSARPRLFNLGWSKRSIDWRVNGLERNKEAGSRAPRIERGFFLLFCLPRPEGSAVHSIVRVLLLMISLWGAIKTANRSEYQWTRHCCCAHWGHMTFKCWWTGPACLWGLLHRIVLS